MGGRGRTQLCGAQGGLLSESCLAAEWMDAAASRCVHRFGDGGAASGGGGGLGREEQGEEGMVVQIGEAWGA